MNIAIIPARGGSKRIPRKNIKEFNGKPIIAYSIEKALDTNLFDKVIVSTDDEEIAEVSKLYGAEIPFIRPKDISDDFTGINPVISHALRTIDIKNINYACCIFATSPLLLIADLVNSFKLIKEDKYKFIFSATNFPHPIERAFKLSNLNKGLEMLYPDKYMDRSQDLGDWMHDAGQFYWGSTGSWLEESMNFDHNSSAMILPTWRVQDIDTYEDWERAELLAKLINSN